MKIGILGGTFDPIHLGHLVLAEEVCDALPLEKVIFIPTYLTPHKGHRPYASVAERFAMVRLAIRGNPRFKISSLELKKRGKSFTVDTLREFRKIYPADDLYFITGSDSLFSLPSWKEIEDIFSLAKFVVGRRPGYPIEGVPKRVIVVKISPIDISSSQLRRMIKYKKSVRYLVSEPVRRYMAKKRLYR